MEQKSPEEYVRRIARSEAERMIRSLEQRLVQAEARRPHAERSRGGRGERVLQEVARRGGRVSRDEWRAIGRAEGYDPRGLGGFFTGQRPSVRETKDGMVVLAEHGRSSLQIAAMVRPSAAKGFSFPKKPRRWGGRPLAEYVIEGRR